MATEWIRADQVSAGDLVRVPYGSSRAYHASRDDAERDDGMPFRCVARTEQGAWFADGTPADLASGETSFWFKDGGFHLLPRDGRVLRARPEQG